MKKILSLVLCVVLVVSMMFTMTGCFLDEQGKYIGTWKGTIDLTDIMNEELDND